MSEIKTFTVQIEVDEEPNQTEAKALVDVSGDMLGGWGRARRNPTDLDRPRLGDELAMARALSDLSHRLLDDVASRLEMAEGRPVDLHL